VARSLRRKSPCCLSTITWVFLAFVVFTCISLLSSRPAVAASLSARSGQCAVLGSKSSGPCVTALQKQLNEHHAKPRLVVDGVYGPHTYQAVEYYQREEGLRVDGIAGTATVRSLDSQPKKNEKPASNSNPSTAGMSLPGTSFWESTLRFPPTTSTLVILCTTFVVLVSVFLWFVHRVWVHERTKKMDLRIPGVGKLSSEKHPNNMELRAQLGAEFLKHQPLPPSDDFFRSIEGGDS
jgi:hypothetical protein